MEATGEGDLLRAPLLPLPPQTAPEPSAGSSAGADADELASSLLLLLPQADFATLPRTSLSDLITPPPRPTLFDQSPEIKRVNQLVLVLEIN